MNNLFKVDGNRIKQCFVANIRCCQQYWTMLLSLNQPAIGCNNAEQHCWQHWTMLAAQHVQSCFNQPWTSWYLFAVQSLIRHKQKRKHKTKENAKYYSHASVRHKMYKKSREKRSLLKFHRTIFSLFLRLCLRLSEYIMDHNTIVLSTIWCG